MSETCVHCGKEPDDCERAECMYIPQRRARRAQPSGSDYIEGTERMNPKNPDPAEAGDRAALLGEPVGLHEAFEAYLARTHKTNPRQVSKSGALGYDEEEWLGFEAGYRDALSPQSPGGDTSSMHGSLKAMRDDRSIDGVPFSHYVDGLQGG